MAFDTKPVNKVSDAEWFLKEASEKLGWKDLSGNVIMDIGCGTGKSSTTFLELFPNVQKIIAIDLHVRNAEAAQANNPHEKLEYKVADIQDWLTLRKLEGKISKVISTYCFNTLWQMEWAFRNLHMILQHDGEAALLIKLYGSYDKFLEKLYLNEEWKPYLSPESEVNPPKHIQKMTDKDYQSLAQMAGFEVVECKAIERVYYYDSEDEFRNSLFHSIPFAKRMPLPQSMQAKFKDYLLESMLSVNPRTEDGKFCIRNNVLSLLLRRLQLKKES